MTNHVKHLFMSLFAICIISLVIKMFVQICPFLNWAVSLLLIFKISSYILKTSPLLVKYYTYKDFLSGCGLFFHSLNNFKRAEVFDLMKSNFFVDCAFGVVPNKSLVYSRSQSFVSYISSRTLIVLCFTFKTLIHFWNFCMQCKIWIKVFFFFFAYRYSMVPVPFVEGTIIFPLIWFCTFVKNWLSGSFSGFSILFCWCKCLSLCQYVTVLSTVALE